jgi:hypothetical protein
MNGQALRTNLPLAPTLAVLLVLGSLLGAGCVGVRASDTVGPRVTLPASPGWYAGQRVYYITTEITDLTMAKNAGYTYAPRLGDAVPAYPKPPGVRTVLERVYKFPNGEQDAVFASAPTPPGPASTDKVYSPLWIAYLVRWKEGAGRRVLTSEEAVLAAGDAGDVSVERTDIVINCPIVWTATGGPLPGAELRR